MDGKMKTTQVAIDKTKNTQIAIDHFGTPAKLARALGVSPQLVNSWRHRGLPAERCRQIHKATKGKVSVVMLNPKLFKN